jgi:ring-1,2-phenylacetyl-CoA epoxidase subunit PaaC
MSMSESVSKAVKCELLCIADSNWVLGHWYTNCMLNGRELTDFTSMAGIAEDKLGHVRALFRFMEEYYELPEHQLEFGRDIDAVHSMELLDAPPQNWADFILTLFLADAAIWRLENTLRDGNFTAVANLTTKFGEEVYFHQLCLDGWLKALDGAEKADLLVALPSRLSQAHAWFNSADDDPLLEAGIRTQSVTDAKTSFTEVVLTKLGAIVELPDDIMGAADVVAAADVVGAASRRDWDPLRRRTASSTMPPRLWESIVPTSEEALIARRPLAVSVDDNIDLFGKIKKDETEPQF